MLGREIWDLKKVEKGKERERSFDLAQAISQLSFDKATKKRKKEK